ncbi:MAG: ABC-2 transporter permease, partial [Tissierellia bacterium]|nr:ABC-2 transporter permease [Tissierellia bacterium]
ASTIIFDERSYYPAAIYLSCMLFFYFTVNKMCYVEDERDTRMFLKTLPIRNNGLVLEKYLMSLISIIMSSFIVHVIYGVINLLLLHEKRIFDWKIELLLALFLVLYSFIFIFLNYKFDYSKTKLTSAIICISIFFLYYSRKSIININLEINSLVLVIVFIMTIIISYNILKRLKF